MHTEDIAILRRKACEAIAALGQVVDQLRVLEQIREIPNKDASADAKAESETVVSLVEATGSAYVSTQDLMSLADRATLKTFATA